MQALSEKKLYGFGGSSVFTDKRLEDMSPQEYQDYYNKVQLSFSRNSALNSLNPNTGTTKSSTDSNSGTSGTSSLFGNLSSYTDQAKDLARFNLGLNKDQETFDLGLRETEAQSNFGRTTQLADQQIGGQYKLGEQQITGQKDITNIQQNATTDRLQRQLTSQQGMQKSGFDQQNLYRAQSAALALRGLR